MTKPALTPRAEAERAARLQREAAALRENLRRRKGQVREQDSVAKGGALPRTPPEDGRPLDTLG